MSKVTGQVWKLFDKEFRGKKLWSFRLENDPLYYRLNEDRNAGVVEPGNYVEFDAETNSDGKSAQVKGKVSRVQPAQAPAQASGAVYSGGGTGRDASIQYQSARKDALVFVQLAVTSGAIALPAKTSAKLAALEALVDAYTAQYLEDISTGGAVTRTTERAYAEEQAEPTPAPGKPKKQARAPVEAEDDDGFEDDDE